jgi:hypothetical protein
MRDGPTSTFIFLEDFLLSVEPEQFSFLRLNTNANSPQSAGILVMCGVKVRPYLLLLLVDGGTRL